MPSSPVNTNASASMYWNCLHCNYRYHVADRNEAADSYCPKCRSFQSGVVHQISYDFQRKVATTKALAGSWFVNGMVAGIALGVSTLVIMLTGRVVLGKVIHLGEMTTRYMWFSAGISTLVCLGHWGEQADKRNSTGGNFLGIAAYILISCFVGFGRGVFWGVFWFAYVIWDGLKLAWETLGSFLYH